MLFQKKNRFRPFYKKFKKLSENIRNSEKILTFKKKKWDFLKFMITRKLKWYNKTKQYTQSKYVVCRKANNWDSFRKGKHRHILFIAKKFMIFYGYLTRKKIRVFIKKALNKARIKTSLLYLNFLKLFESRLDIVLNRSKFCNSIKTCRQLIAHSGVLVNNKIITDYSYKLKEGDSVKIKKKFRRLIERNIAHTDITAIPPKHLIINYKILQFIFGTIDNTLTSNFKFNLHLEKLLLNYLR